MNRGDFDLQIVRIPDKSDARLRNLAESALIEANHSGEFVVDVSAVRR